MKQNITVDLRCTGCGSENLAVNTDNGYLVAACVDCRLTVKMGFVVKDIIAPSPRSRDDTRSV